MALQLQLCSIICYNLFFTDDYRVTSCCGFIKHFLTKFNIDASQYITVESLLSSRKKYSARSKSYFLGMTTRMALEETMKANEEFDMKLCRTCPMTFHDTQVNYLSLFTICLQIYMKNKIQDLKIFQSKI